MQQSRYSRGTHIDGMPLQHCPYKKYSNCHHLLSRKIAKPVCRDDEISYKVPRADSMTSLQILSSLFASFSLANFIPFFTIHSSAIPYFTSMVTTSVVNMTPTPQQPLAQPYLSSENSQISMVEEEVLELYKHYISDIDATLSAKMLRYRSNESDESHYDLKK